MAHFHNPPTLTDAQIQLAHDMHAVRSAVAKGFLIGPDPEIEGERTERAKSMGGELPMGGVWWSNRAGECRLCGSHEDPRDEDGPEVWTEVHAGTKIVRWVNENADYSRFLAEGTDANTRGDADWIIDPNQDDEALLNGAGSLRPDRDSQREKAKERERAEADRVKSDNDADNAERMLAGQIRPDNPDQIRADRDRPVKGAD